MLYCHHLIQRITMYILKISLYVAETGIQVLKCNCILKNTIEELEHSGELESVVALGSEKTGVV